MIERLKIVNNICKNVGITQRVNSESEYLTKRELMEINSWVQLKKDEVKSGEES